MIQENSLVMEVTGLSFSYNPDRPVFSGVSFSLGRGDIFTILGPNGSGKSTLLDCLAGSLKPAEGSIKLEGERMDHISSGDIARKMGYVPQVYTPAYAYNVRDYVVMGRAPHIGFMELPDKKDYALVDAALADLHISHLAYKPYSQISGGERQQVQIARILVQESKIILLDEPTNHLDYGNQLHILRLIAGLAESGHTIIMTTHIPDQAILLGGKIGIITSQGSFTTGEVDQIFSEQLLRGLYNTDLHLIYIESLGRTVCVTGAVR